MYTYDLTLSLHDALAISAPIQRGQIVDRAQSAQIDIADRDRLAHRLNQSSSASSRRSYISPSAPRSDSRFRTTSGSPSFGNARSVRAAFASSSIQSPDRKSTRLNSSP